MIPGPYLLYLGHSADPVAIKTSRGLAAFRREDCVGEFRHDDCPLTLDLRRLSMSEGVEAGARTLVLGIAGAGRRRFRHAQPRQPERQRTIVMAELADAILAPKRRHAARGLDAERIGAVAEIEEERPRDHLQGC